ncbi:TonB-dependent receptor [Rhodanobacter terrae]|uniref:TonB-dependent receptor n=1 Tax=Rhodanobacter terrae TaxID=418647 RepID=A0ABW0SXT4_9GAMM
MNRPHAARRSMLATAVATALGLMTAGLLPAGAASAADVADAAAATPPTTTTGTMGSNTRIVQLKKVEVKAGTETTGDQAPSQASLVATEPQSIIGSRYIENVAASTANYSDIVKIAPSVSDVDPNGPGLMESQGLSVRGFQNGEYNVTFDGIPWGDSNDFTQHSTSYFMPQDIGQVTIDRGPGSARTLGNATFGGTLSVDSKDPEPVMGINPFFSVGSFNTQVEGLRFDTGTMNQYGGTTAYFSAKNLSSDGYLTNAALDRQNFFTKIVQPLGENTTLTFASNLTRLHQNVSLGATRAQIEQYGPDYGLSADPTSQSFYGYNFDKITTDFEYLDLETRWDGWNIGDKLYTYGYRHKGYNGSDPNGEQPNGTVYGPNDVPGQRMRMDYRSVGDILRLSHDLGPGEIHLGGWADRQTNHRLQYEIDWSNGGALNAVPTSAAIDRLMNDSLTDMQTYAEYEWHATDKLDITGGAKYVNFRRTLDAQVNQKTGLPIHYAQTWTRALPSVDMHYGLSDHWSAYAQWAKGFLAPNLNTFYTADPAANQVKPEGTTNEQIGTAWNSDGLTLSFDAYHIDFNNKIESRKIGTVTQYYNAGGAIYKGVEGEATVAIADGFSVYANASLNDAKVKGTNEWLPNAPNRTAALGLLFDSGPWSLSLIDKYVGVRYGDSGQTQRLGGYASADFAASYAFMHPLQAMKDVEVTFKVANLGDNKSIYALAGYTSQDNNPLYWTIPERSFELDVSAHL